MAFTDSGINCSVLESSMPQKITLGAACKAGDALGYDSGWKLALATTSSVVQLRCVAGEDGASGDIITAYFGPCVLGGERFTGATAGALIYVAEGSASGDYTETIPSTSGDATTQAGLVLYEGTTYDTILVTPNYVVDTTA